MARKPWSERIPAAIARARRLLGGHRRSALSSSRCAFAFSRAMRREALKPRALRFDFAWDTFPFTLRLPSQSLRSSQPLRAAIPRVYRADTSPDPSRTRGSLRGPHRLA